ncbi:MAG: tRNA (adenosine(37)-N6)-threonylcarbamoyltransferase complex ATPase subunit type 1 TsaE [Gammaproteobacteria bacterium]|nr:tRNA (adenosine(37)-N6)-threonylcarbamoyltransferase complex ATPase subunit type 1 TsaE [Gammaproteobacteria bacterium]
MDVKLVVKNETALHKFAATLADVCRTYLGTIIFLQGELGAGKTTFARGFLHELGHQGHVKSPTYTYVESYEIDDVIVHHFDLYRVKDPHELEQMGLRDYFTETSLCLIEWPEYGRPYLPVADLICHIDFASTGRVVHLLAASPRGKEILERCGYGI